MTDWRLKAFKSWQEMEEPEWANVKYSKPDFQKISYYSAPKGKDKYDSLDEVDPELLKTFEKLGISINEQKKLTGVAVDIVVDSVSVATTFNDTLSKKGIIFFLNGTVTFTPAISSSLIFLIIFFNPFSSIFLFS